MFLEDSPGLDFFNGQLYAVDNGTGKFWILDVAADGKLSFANGFSDGKRVRFQKDAENEKAASPDAEGITVDGDGYVYLACERDNSAKGVNYNTILKVDPKAEGTDLIAMQEWNLTESLPQVSANMGMEAVEWVANAETNVVHVKPPSSVDVILNYEGFAIAEAEYAVNGTRAVYRFQDGVTTGSLLIGSVAHRDASDDTTPPADEDEENTNPPTDEEEKAPENNMEESGNNDNNGETDTRVEAPQTGDDTNVIFYVIVIMLATAFIAYRIKKNSIASWEKY